MCLGLILARYLFKSMRLCRGLYLVRHVGVVGRILVHFIL